MSKSEKVKEALEFYATRKAYDGDYDLHIDAGRLAKEALAELNDYTEENTKREEKLVEHLRRVVNRYKSVDRSVCGMGMLGKLQICDEVEGVLAELGIKE